MTKKGLKNMTLSERLKEDSELVRKLKVNLLGFFGRKGNVNASKIEKFFRENHYSLDESRNVSGSLAGKAFHYEGIMGNTLEFLPGDKKGNLNYNLYVFDSSYRNNH